MIKEEYEWLIVGSGFYGAICADYLRRCGKSVAVVEKRDHIGGNCYTKKLDGIDLHTYGPHIFHTNNPDVWDWINQYAEFNSYRHAGIASYQGRVYSLPFSMYTFQQIYGATTPDEAKAAIKENGYGSYEDPRNLEEAAIQAVGKPVYEILIKGYTEKQWMKPATELPASIVRRLPVRYTYDNNYYNDRYQGIPIGGYTQIFEKLLEGIPVIVNTDFFLDEIPRWKNLIYTGPIDRFFGYSHGSLEYKTVHLDHEWQEKDNVQGCAVMNYTDIEVPYTRKIEHKHFVGGGGNGSWVSTEYSVPYDPDKTDPYYPVNDAHNNAIYEKYKEMANALPNVHFGGRLGQYRYFDMHQVIEEALNFCKKI
jgi:UDP-galactopyranose mutase